MAKLEYQLSQHGAGKYSVQLFDIQTRELIDDADIVKDVNGWRVVSLNLDGYISDCPQHASPAAAARWHATQMSVASSAE